MKNVGEPRSVRLPHNEANFRNVHSIEKSGILRFVARMYACAC